MVASKVAAAVPPWGSRAVTVIVAFPAATGVILTAKPITSTVAMASSLDVAVYSRLRSGPSGSENTESAYAISAAPPTVPVTASMAPSTTGASLGMVISDIGDHSLKPSPLNA